MLFSAISIAQIDLLSDFYINKNVFQNPNDSIYLQVKVKKTGVTNSEPTGDKIRVKAELSSSQYSIQDEKIHNIYNIELACKEKQDDSYIYSISIPVSLMEKGRYDIKLLSTDDNWNTTVSLKDFDPSPAPISIGETGFVMILGDFEINSDLFKYSFLDFANTYNLLPHYLEGIYSTGFCNDELIALNNIKVHFWTTKQAQFELKAYYSLDNNEFEQISDFELIDDSSDGVLDFDNNSEQYNFYYNEDIKDYSVILKPQLNDILNNLNITESGEHRLRIFFKLNTANKELRFPEDNFITTFLKVVDAPQGADCQYELLPIDLLSFDVIKQNKSVHIKWITVSEVNNDYFEIQKSTDTKNWQVLKKIYGKGNMNTQNIYEYTDKYPLPGQSYYRLRQTDFDGDFKYSRVKVIYNFENKLKIYPNPASEYLYYSILDPGKEFDVNIYSSKGQIIKSFVLPDKFRNDFKIDISQYPKGTYFIKYINRQTHQVEINSFIKI